MEVTPQELKKELDAKKKLLLIDVRQPEEFNFVRLEGSVNIPLPEFQARISELPKDADVVTVCHHGNRSMQAAVILNSLDYKARSLKGGQEEWARQIDKSMIKYDKNL